MAELRKYATGTASGTHIGIQMPIAGSPNFATGSDWTPATGDVKIGIDGGATANITTLPAYTNGWWIFQLTVGETTGKSIRVSIVDAATKAVDDNAFVIETFGNASAMYPDDLSTASATAPTNWALQSIDASGRIDVGKILGTASAGTAGYVGLDWAHITAPTTSVALTGTTISTSQVAASVTGAVGSVTARVTANTDQLGGQTVSAAAGVTFPTSVASPTNITAGTITTVTNLTNAPTVGDFTATMKTSITTAATAATPTAALSASERNSTADALLARNVKGGSTGTAVQSVAAALASGLMNFSETGGAALTVLYPDGTTAYTRTLTRAQYNAIVSST